MNTLAETACSWWLALDRYRTEGDVASLEHMLACREAHESALAEPRIAHMLERLALDAGEQMLVTLLLVSGEPEIHALLTRTAAPLEPATSAATLARVVLGPLKFAAALTSFSNSSRLRRFAIIERCDAGGPNVHEARWAWALSRRVLALLHGESCIDDATACLRIFAPDAVEQTELALAGEARARLQRIDFREHQIVVCTGLPGLGKRLAVKQACAARGLNVTEARATDLDTDPIRLAAQLRAIARDVVLCDAVMLIARIDELADDRRALIVSELVANVPRTLVLTTGVDRPTLQSTIPIEVVELTSPPTEQMARLWRQSLAMSDSDAAMMASRYPLAPSLVHRVADAAKRRSEGRTLTEDDVYFGLRSVTDLRLREHARRLPVTQVWSDLVLSSDQIASIRELMARVRHRAKVYETWGFGAKVGKGLGVSALFSGPPGTGKSMVAGLIAKDLGLEVYQVDVAKIVSKRPRSNSLRFLTSRRQPKPSCCSTKPTRCSASGPK